MQIESPKTNNFPWALIIAATTIIIAAVAFYVFFLKPVALDPFNVGNFYGKAEFYSKEKRDWVPLQRGQLFQAGDRIRTSDDSEATLLIKDKIQVRVKKGSEVRYVKPSPFESDPAQRFFIEDGLILGATSKGFTPEDLFEIETPVSVAAVRGTMFLIAHSAATNQTRVSVLQGKVEVMAGEENVMVDNLNNVSVDAGKPIGKPARITRQEWLELKEAYDLIQRDADYEKKQKDLSKEAGGLFDVIFDHGTFYMPKFGFAMREFEKNELTGEVYLNVQYDVFPKGTFAGVYLKTREFDISKYGTLKFQIRRMPNEGYPDGFRIEFKYKSQVIRAFAPKTFKKSWRPMEFKISASKETPIDEVTFVFTHDKVGEFKKGALQLKDIDLTPKTEDSRPSSESETVTPGRWKALGVDDEVSTIVT